MPIFSHLIASGVWEEHFIIVLYSPDIYSGMEHGTLSMKVLSRSVRERRKSNNFYVRAEIQMNLIFGLKKFYQLFQLMGLRGWIYLVLIEMRGFFKEAIF